MLHWERRTDCSAPKVAMPRTFSLRYWVMILPIVVLTRPQGIDAATYTVSPDGDGDNYILSDAMELAGPGDEVQLKDGIYADQLASVRNGEEGNPITITGGEGAIIKPSTSPAVLVTHSHVHLQGFSVDGFHGFGDTVDSWVHQCIWVDGEEENGDITPIEGFKMQDMLIQNCGSECVRLKNFVTGAIISKNIIQDCGIYYFKFGEGEKSGEGVYIGTPDNEWTYGEDVCDLNYVSGNTFITNGNECVDIKEGSTKNVVERNMCSYQLDEDSGCFSFRGDANTIRFNVASFCSGAGVRLGGDEADGHQYGHSNNVYGNDITKAEFGSIKVQTDNQGLICGNICEEGACSIRGSHGETVEATFFEGCQLEALIAHLEEVPALE